jgi:hypothetical protein
MLYSLGSKNIIIKLMKYLKHYVEQIQMDDILDICE